jgi:hypothetical protein
MGMGCQFVLSPLSYLSVHSSHGATTNFEFSVPQATTVELGGDLMFPKLSPTDPANRREPSCGDGSCRMNLWYQETDERSSLSVMVRLVRVVRPNSGLQQTKAR